MEAGDLVYLDTSVAIWLYAGLADRLTPAARLAIETGRLCVSPAVVLEVTALREARRFSHRAEDLVQQLGKQLGVTVCDLGFPQLAAAAVGLAWARDPYDRLIVGHAVAQQACLVSADDTIRRHYERTIW